MDWLNATRGSRVDFWVQTAPKQQWHVETRAHCERMLCGAFISVDSRTAKIRTIPPTRAYACGDCWLRLQVRKVEEVE